jgi:hypothetical protein
MIHRCIRAAAFIALLTATAFVATDGLAPSRTSGRSGYISSSLGGSRGVMNHIVSFQPLGNVGEFFLLVGIVSGLLILMLLLFPSKDS